MYLLIELFLNSNYPSPQLDGNKKSQLYEKHLIEELSESGECRVAQDRCCFRGHRAGCQACGGEARR